MNKVKNTLTVVTVGLLFLTIFFGGTYAEEGDIRYSPGYCPVWSSTDLSAEPIGEINGINVTFLLLEEITDDVTGYEYGKIRTTDGVEGYVPLLFCQLETPLEPVVAE